MQKLALGSIFISFFVLSFIFLGNINFVQADFCSGQIGPCYDFNQKCSIDARDCSPGQAVCAFWEGSCQTSWYQSTGVKYCSASSQNACIYTTLSCYTCASTSCNTHINCAWIYSPPPPTPTPGGSPCGWCAGDPQCSGAGGTASANAWCANGFCCNGVGGGGGPPPPPSCTVSLAPNPTNITAGNASTMTATVAVQNGTLNQINFSSSNASVATVTTPALAAPYQTTLTGVGTGASTITASVIVNGSATCSTTAIANVASAPGWWQAVGGDVITNGNLQSVIPTATCVLPGCNPHFITDGTNGPGNAIYTGTANLTSTNASSKGWLGQTTYQGKKYDYSYFSNITPANITFNNLPAIANTADFTGGTSSDGYYWYKVNGDLTLASAINVIGTRKIIVFVNGGDFNINAKINIATKGSGFFMVMVGKDANGNKGNINIGAAVTGNPSLEGIYEADNNFDTAVAVNNLYVRGTVVSWGSVGLKRNLATNTTAPAETFEYAPDQVILFPRDLVQDRSAWQEVLP